jgi:hypothetical protein
MSIDAIIVGGILALAVLITTIVLLATNARDHLLPEETAVAIYSEICGARLGARNWSKPFVQLRVHGHFLVLGCVQPLLLPYSAMTDVRRTRTSLGRGVIIDHNLQAAPQPVVIWTNNETKLIALLELYSTHAVCD